MKLLNAGDRMSSATRTLQDARRALGDTEVVAMEITTNLDENRTKIEKARKRARKLRGEISVARRVATAMRLHDIRARIALGVVILIVVGAFLIGGVLILRSMFGDLM